MEPEQRQRYTEYEDMAARLASIAKRRPLTKEEMEKLQIFLSCMRMLCDTPYILDADCRICPKLHELGNILEDAVSSGDSKIIIFSEWARMLELARELAINMKLGFAWHTGSVPQQKRRLEINRFKQDPNCRLFLSTDSGATGLNLQGVNLVVARFLRVPVDSVRDVSTRMVLDGFDSWKTHLFNFVVAFRSTRHSAIVEDAPLMELDVPLRALCASVTEALCRKLSVETPAWCAGVPALKTPWFVSGIENLKATALLESPAWFRARRIFVLDNFLKRA